MIIQIKSSYSGPQSHHLEDSQELFIGHTHVTHAYVQKQADGNAVARLYLSRGELHLAPVSRMENVFLQNRPFTEDKVLGNECLLQIKESILLFEGNGEIVVIMMGLSLGYGGSSALKSVKVAELPPPPTTTSPTGRASEGKRELPPPPVRPLVEKVVEERRQTELEKLAERYGGNDDDILLSESSITVGGIVKSVPRMEPSTGGKWKSVAIMACLMVVICVAMWFVARREPVAPPVNTPSVAVRKTETVVPQDIGGASKAENEQVAEDVKTSPAAMLSMVTKVKTEETAKEHAVTVATRVGMVVEDVRASSSAMPLVEATVKMEEAVPLANENVLASVKTIILPGGVELKFVKVEPGSFTNTVINKRITLTREYWIGETEVTQGQYAAIMDGVVNEKGETCKPRPSYFTGDDRLPVECVSWYDAMAFCRKLNSLHEGKLPRGYRFDLPTEAQWEFVARGGNKTKGYEYSGGKDIDAVAWYVENSKKRTHPVGGRQVNELGLYDMSGNVWEWCRDWYDKAWGHDPEMLSDMKSGSYRVLRGGGWFYGARGCRSAYRLSSAPSSRDNSLGFRVALVPVDSQPAVSSKDAGKIQNEKTNADDKAIAESSNQTPESKRMDNPPVEGVEYKTIVLPGNVELKLVKVEPGSFRNTGMVKTFTLSHEYWLGETEVTQGQYAAIMEGVTNEKGESCKTHPSLFKNNRRPVEFVSWYDAKAFCKKLNSLFSGTLPQGYQFDLPTEAQWEFAARGGNKSRGYEYSGGDDIETVAWYSGNSGGITHTVGMKQTNELGLHDMSGNVWEWCRDWYDNDWNHEPETLARMKSGSYRVRRGGAWINPVGSCRSSYRSYSDPAIRFDRIGFRVALVSVQ